MTAVELKIKGVLIKFGHSWAEINDKSFQEKLEVIWKYDISKKIKNETDEEVAYWHMILPYFELTPVKKEPNDD